MAQDVSPPRSATEVRTVNRDSATRDAVVNFNSLPGDAIIRVRAVAALRGCSVPTVWRHVSVGLLAKPQKLGGITGWRVADVRASLRAEVSQ
jgi:predicted DNA-binding transcriptional regulator AlpA